MHFARFEKRKGEVEEARVEAHDLNEAIVLIREALELCPQGHPLRFDCLDDLAKRLSDWYKQLGAMQDLNEVIVICREALGPFPQGHPHLFTRYEQLRVVQDFNEAIDLSRAALNLRPRGHHDRSGPLKNLVVRLSDRYKQLEAKEDLGREALELYPRGRPLQFHYLFIISPLATSGSQKCKTLRSSLSLAAKHSTFAHKDTLIDQGR